MTTTSNSLKTRKIGYGWYETTDGMFRLDSSDERSAGCRWIVKKRRDWCMREYVRTQNCPEDLHAGDQACNGEGYCLPNWDYEGEFYTKGEALAALQYAYYNN